jgi:uncharacterized membrane protein YqjE
MRGGDGAMSSRVTYEEPSLGELFGRLSTDTRNLVQQEIALAKTEMRDVGAAAGKSAMSIGIALILAICGAAALTAFAIIGLGDLTGGYYALWALGVGIVVLAFAGFLAKSAVNRVKKGLKPQQTIETLRENTAWAGREVKDLKRDVTADPQLTPTRG